jgi:hypothetical protein
VERLKAAVARREELFLTFDPVSMEILDAQPASGQPPASDSSMILSPSRAAKPLADVISEARALKEFRFLASQKSIPFDYPPNCCWSRAHQMARLMAGNGIASEKYWNFGSGWSAGKFTIKTPTPSGKSHTSNGSTTSRRSSRCETPPETRFGESWIHRCSQNPYR